MVEWWLQVPGPAVGSEVRKSQGSGNDGAPAEAASLGEARPEGSGSLGWGCERKEREGSSEDGARRCLMAWSAGGG